MPQSIPKNLTREHVLKAIADIDAGIEHSFGSSTKFELVHTGKRYAPKAVIGIAFRHLTGAILHHSMFSGGEAPGQANYELRRLGFNVEGRAPEATTQDVGKVWTDDEVRILLNDYFDMLQLDLLGSNYNKAEHNRSLREQLGDRSKGSVEFKHQNVSAVLLKLGLPYINGYKPAQNFQVSMVGIVRDFVESHPKLYTVLDESTRSTLDGVPKLDNWEQLFESPPEGSPISDQPPATWQPRPSRKIDFVSRDAANHRLGRLGEEFALELERRRLRGLGRDDLAGKVEWISDTRGDGMGYDLLSFDEQNDSEKYIEVKTTAQGKYFPFYVSSNEVRCSEATAPKYHLYRLFRFTQRPRLFVLHGALSDLCRLDPISYRATVGRGGSRQDV